MIQKNAGTNHTGQVKDAEFGTDSLFVLLRRRQNIATAIISSLDQEIGHYLKIGGFELAKQHGYLKVYDSSFKSGVIVIVGGVGRENIEQATELAINTYGVEQIIYAGFAGGVHEDAKTGDVYVCDKLFSLQGPAPFWQQDSVNEITIGNLNSMTDLIPSDSRASHSVSAVLSIPNRVSGTKMKSWIGETFPVRIIDMESYWASLLASSQNVRHAVIRTVLDPLGQALPVFATKAVYNNSDSNWAKEIGYVFKNPNQIFPLINITSQTRLARNSLGKFLNSLSLQI